MKRRQFMIAVTSASLLALAGCGEKPGEKFMGYWQYETEHKYPTVIHIARNGDGILFTVSQWAGLFGSPRYEPTTQPATVNKSANTLLVANRSDIAYEESTDKLLTGRAKARRITEAEYKAVLSKSKP